VGVWRRIDRLYNRCIATQIIFFACPHPHTHTRSSCLTLTEVVIKAVVEEMEDGRGIGFIHCTYQHSGHTKTKQKYIYIYKDKPAVEVYNY